MWGGGGGMTISSNPYDDTIDGTVADPLTAMAKAKKKPLPVIVPDWNDYGLSGMRRGEGPVNDIRRTRTIYPDKSGYGGGNWMDKPSPYKLTPMGASNMGTSITSIPQFGGVTPEGLARMAAARRMMGL